MFKTKAYIGHLLSLITIVIYSYNANIMKLLMPTHISAFGLVLLRAIITFIIFFLLSLFIKEKRVVIKASDKLKIIYLGIFGLSAQLLFYIKGTEMTGPIDVVVIRSLIPITVIALSSLFFRRKSSINEIIGIILGIAGVIYMYIIPNNSGIVEDSIVGDILITFSTIFVAIYFIKIGDIIRKVPLFTLMKMLSFYGLVFTIPFGFKELLKAPLFDSRLTLDIIWYLVVTTILTGVIGNLFSIIALKYITPVIRSIYFYFMPIIGTLIAIILKIQYPTIHDLIAFFIIIVGFILINRASFIHTTNPE